MNFRRLKPGPEIDWKNPLLNPKQFPHLGQLFFPTEINSPTAVKSNLLLEKLYCEDREQGKEDVTIFESFINNPDRRIFVIWGDVGIGKTIFVRYQSLKYKKRNTCFPGGVVDLLRGGIHAESAYTIYQQICPILRGYFTYYHQNTYNAVYQFQHYRAKSNRGDSATEEVISADAKMMANDVMKLQDGKELAELLLSTLEYVSNKPLFVVVDNIDKTFPDEQDNLLKIATRLLKNVSIKLIIPLRKSSLILGDKFRALNENLYLDMTLSPIVLTKMLAIRFKYDSEGNAIENFILEDQIKNKTFKFNNLFAFLNDRRPVDSISPVELISQLSRPNAREFLNMIQRVLTSRQLDGLENLNNCQYIIASLMLEDESAADPCEPHIINLFENEEPGIDGNRLIRFRTLEYFSLHGNKGSDPNDASFKNYFERLGYNQDHLRRIVNVIKLFVGRNILSSSKNITTDEIDIKNIEKLGRFSLTPTGHAYFEILMKSEWYHVSVKRSMLLPSTIIKTDEKGSEFIKHKVYYSILRDAEKYETSKIREWEARNGIKKVTLYPPSNYIKSMFKLGE